MCYHRHNGNYVIISIITKFEGSSQRIESRRTTVLSGTVAFCRLFRFAFHSSIFVSNFLGRQNFYENSSEVSRACFPCDVQFVWKWCTRNNWKIWLHVNRAVVLVIVIISFFEYWLRLFFSMYPDIIHLPRISWKFSWDFMSRHELSFSLIWLECRQYGYRQVISLISGQRAFWERVLWSIRFFVTFPYIFVSLAMLSRLG